MKANDPQEIILNMPYISILDFIEFTEIWQLKMFLLFKLSQKAKSSSMSLNTSTVTMFVISCMHFT